MVLAQVGDQGLEDFGVQIFRVGRLQRATYAADYAIGKSDFWEPVWNARAMLRIAIQSLHPRNNFAYIYVCKINISGQYLDNIWTGLDRFQR
jgi:hypothetical protein